MAEIYRLLYPSDTLAFSILSTPDMFQNAFIPFILNKGRLNDPDVECMEHLFDLVKQVIMHTLDLQRILIRTFVAIILIITDSYNVQFDLLLYLYFLNSKMGKHSIVVS